MPPADPAGPAPIDPPEEAVAELCRAYEFLRKLEHRLQYLDDQQTQSLPRGEEDRALIASTMGYASWEEFRHELDRHRSAVSTHFEQIFASNETSADPHAGASPAGSPAPNLALESELMEKRLRELRYAETATLAARVIELKSGSRYRQMSASGQSRIDRLLPRVDDEDRRPGEEEQDRRDDDDERKAARHHLFPSCAAVPAAVRPLSSGSGR